MDRFEIENAINSIDGYLMPPILGRIGDSPEDKFNQAKKEVIEYHQKKIKNIETITFEYFETKKNNSSNRK